MTTAEAVLQAKVQREGALILANQVRTRRAVLKRMVRTRECDLRGLVADPPEVMQRLAVYEVLQWLKGVGPERAKRALFGVCGLSLRLEQVGPATRARIIDRIDDLDPRHIDDPDPSL